MALRLKGTAPKHGAPDKRYYMLDVQDGYRRVRLSTGTRDRVAAERKEQSVLDALRDDPEIPEDALRELIRGKTRSAQLAVAKANARARTLKAAMDEALADPNHWGGKRSLETIKINCKVVQAYLGADQPVNTIDQAAVNNMAKRMREEGAAPATVNRKMQCLLAVLKRERKAGRYVGEVPEYRLADERDNARTFVLTVDDEEMILRRLLDWDTLPNGPAGGHPRVRDGADYRDLFICLADLGCRMSQAIGIRWSEVVEQSGRLHVRFWRHETLKKGRPRTLPCTARVAEVLRRRREAHGTTAEGPFSMLNRTRATRMWQWAIKGTHLANEKECVPHALRHSCATRLLLATGNIKLVQEWLGHRDIQTTSSVYAKVLAEQSLQGMSALEQFRLPAASNALGDVPRQGSIAKSGIQ